MGSRASGSLQAFGVILRSRGARLIAGGILFLVWIGLPIPEASDAANYWQVDLSDPYGTPWLAPDSFVYPPPVALLISPFTALPFEVFYRLLLAANLAAMVWMVGWVGAAFALLLPPVQSELQVGNIHLLIGAAIVLGLHRSAAWSLPILTKVTPIVGLTWFAVRREWRSTAIAVGTTAAIVVGTWFFVADLWVEWLDLVTAAVPVDSGVAYTVIEAPLLLRLLIAAGLLAIAGVRGWAWAVPIGVLISLPAVWYSALSMLLAVVPLRVSRRVRSVTQPSEGTGTLPAARPLPPG
jgi:hypothetical protein